MIEISVFGVKDFTFTRRISSSGFITLPYVGKIGVTGSTTVELEEDLTSRLAGRLIRDPQVSIFVMEFQSQLCVILGAVNSPGLIEMSRPQRLLDIIGTAGGLASDRGDVISVYRKSIGLWQEGGIPSDGMGGEDQHNGENGGSGQSSGSESQKPATFQVRLKALLEEGALSENIPIRGGDVIYVPKKPDPRFYIIGEVLSPGPYKLPDDRGLLLSQAVSMAGGPMRTAKMNKGVLIRYRTGGVREELPVNFSDILKGKKPDFLVRKDDVIFIPGSLIKSIGYGLLGIVPNIAMQSATVTGR